MRRVFEMTANGVRVLNTFHAKSQLFSCNAKEGATNFKN